jgi:hypothetical protein
LNIYGSPLDTVLGSPLKDNSSPLARGVDKSAVESDDGTIITDGIFVKERDGNVILQANLVHAKTSLGEELEVLADD